MHYHTREELPKQIKKPLKHIPHAQEMYINAFNSAIRAYHDENFANNVAWSVVEQKYEKSGDGSWHKKYANIS